MHSLTRMNPYYRTALWTGRHLQITLMTIPVHADIGLEIHPDLDQFLYIESGYGLVLMGRNKSIPDIRQTICTGCGIVVPAGAWHNLINTGKMPLKLFSVYAPPQHPFGTVHKTKKDSEAAGHTEEL